LLRCQDPYRLLSAAASCALGASVWREQRQRKVECGAAAEFAFRPDAPSVGQHDVLDDSQAEPVAARLADGFVDTVKTFEDGE